MIEIQDINHKTLDDIYTLLLNNKNRSFEIYVPKSTQLFASSSEDIAIDYAMLAYAGQKLSDVSDEFSYNYVSPSNHESVLFEVKTNDINKLAKAIINISYGYNNESDDIVYLDEIYDFLEQVESGITTPVCIEFIDDYKTYCSLSKNE